MGDYHTYYTTGRDETTEWDDLQVKFGNKEKPPPKWKPDKYAPEEEVAKDEAWLDGKDEHDLSDLEDEFDDDAVLAEYRCAGLARSFLLAGWGQTGAGHPAWTCWAGRRRALWTC